MEFLLFRHAKQYIKLDGALDAAFVTMENNLSQMIVVTFLFYSGFGIMESIKKKGTPYVEEIPFKRSFKVFYHMAIAVTLYIIVNAAFGITFDLKRILLAFTAWASIGNSNWYIFAVFVVYMITYVSFIVFRKNNYLAVSCVTLLSVAYICYLIYIDKESYCYNTVILYAIGMWYSLLKEHFEKLTMKNDAVYLSIVAVVVSVYYCIYLKRNEGIEWYSAWGIMFMVLVLLATMKITFGNKILNWFGSHVFSIYILQRLPMIALRELGLVNTHKYVFVVVSFFITIALATVFDKLVNKLDTLIYQPRKKEQLPAQQK